MTRLELYNAVRFYSNRPQLSDADLALLADSAKGALNTALRDHPRMRRSGRYVADAGQELLPLPYDIIALRTIKRGDVVLRQYAPTVTEYPCEGFIERGDCVELTHVPDTQTTFTVEYAQSLPLVTASAHWVRDWFPDVILYAMLRELAVALKDRENGPVWAQRAEQAIAMLAAQGWNQNVAARPVVATR
jgi:hypothetical protein